MPGIGIGINPLRSLVFVRNFGNQVIKKTGTRVRKNAGALARTGIDTKLSPAKIRFNSAKYLVRVQRNRTPQDRLIDFFVWLSTLITPFCKSSNAQIYNLFLNYSTLFPIWIIPRRIIFYLILNYKFLHFYFYYSKLQRSPVIWTFLYLQGGQLKFHTMILFVYE